MLRAIIIIEVADSNVELLSFLSLRATKEADAAGHEQSDDHQQRKDGNSNANGHLEAEMENRIFNIMIQ